MAFELQQKLKLSQQLIMTPQLQMAIKLLQLSRLELIDTVRQEMEENPTLEEVTDIAVEEKSVENSELEPDKTKIKEVTIEEKIHDDIEKIKRLGQWCQDASERQKKIAYKMLYIKQEKWEKYKPKDFKDLIKISGICLCFLPFLSIHLIIGQLYPVNISFSFILFSNNKSNIIFS